LSFIGSQHSANIRNCPDPLMPPQAHNMHNRTAQMVVTNTQEKGTQRENRDERLVKLLNRCWYFHWFR